MSGAEGAGAETPAPTPLDFHIMWKSSDTPDMNIHHVTGSLIEDGFMKLFSDNGKGVFVQLSEALVISFEPS